MIKKKMNHLYDSTLLKMTEEEIRHLLLMEKERRSVQKDTLVFIGMANVASYNWCSMAAVYKSRKNEHGFFNAYLYDRIKYALALGLIDEIPTTSEKKIEAVSKAISLDDVEKVFNEKHKGEVISEENIDAQYLEAVIDITESETPMLRGTTMETNIAERYHTFRWNFEWGNYVVIGVPDGITDEFVYEFKSTKSTYTLSYLKHIAIAQADLYGYFFKRNKKRVQIFVMEERITETWDSETSIKNAEGILNKFKAVENGQLGRPPKEWKRKTCEFASQCELINRKV